MRHEIFPSRPNWRFHPASISGILTQRRIADEMNQEIASRTEEKGSAASERLRPRSRDYFWRPWYARLWWSLAFAFWLIVVFDALVAHVLPRADEGWQLWLVMLFHPYVIVPALGFRYVRDWLAYSGFYDTDEEEPTERLYDGDNGVGFPPSPGKPTHSRDPRYIMLPTNPASPDWRRRNLWGDD